MKKTSTICDISRIIESKTLMSFPKDYTTSRFRKRVYLKYIYWKRLFGAIQTNRSVVLTLVWVFLLCKQCHKNNFVLYWLIKTERIKLFTIDLGLISSCAQYDIRQSFTAIIITNNSWKMMFTNERHTRHQIRFNKFNLYV